MWEFVLKQDNLTVARGRGNDKDFIVNEGGRYFSQYEDEDYCKMTLTIRKVEKKGRVTKENFMDNLTDEEWKNYAKMYD